MNGRAGGGVRPGLVAWVGRWRGRLHHDDALVGAAAGLCRQAGRLDTATQTGHVAAWLVAGVADRLRRTGRRCEQRHAAHGIGWGGNLPLRSWLLPLLAVVELREAA